MQLNKRKNRQRYKIRCNDEIADKSKQFLNSKLKSEEKSKKKQEEDIEWFSKV